MCGIVVISLPITVISSNFAEEFARYTACVQSGGDGFRLTTEDFRLLNHEAAGVAGGANAAAKPASIQALQLQSNSKWGFVRSNMGLMKKAIMGGAGSAATAAALEALRAEMAELRAANSHTRAALNALLRAQGIVSPMV